MKKNDIILIAVILVISFGVALGLGFSRKAASTKEDESYAVVMVDGKEYGRYPLSEDCQERIDVGNGEYNVLVIEDGYVQISEASCRDQICVNHFHIHYSGDAIVCLPNKLVVTIEGGEDDDVDGATN